MPDLVTLNRQYRELINEPSTTVPLTVTLDISAEQPNLAQENISLLRRAALSPVELAASSPLQTQIFTMEDPQGLSEENFLLHKSSFSNAINGDITAQQFYERNRLINIQTLPEWAQVEVVAILYTRYTTIPFRQFARGSTDKKQFVTQMRDGFSKQTIVDFDLESLNFFSDAIKYSEICRGFQRDRHFKVRNQGEEILYGNFSPRDRGPLGAYASDALTQILKTQLAATIMQDCMDLLGIVPPGSICKPILRDLAKEPWSIKDHPRMKMLAELSPEIRASLEVRGENEVWNEVERELTRKRSHRHSDKPEVGAEGAKIDALEKIKLVPQTTVSLVSTVGAAISKFNPDEPNIRQLSRQLAKLVSLGRIDLDDLLAQLENGASPASLVAAVTQKKSPEVTQETRARTDEGIPQEELLNDQLSVSYAMHNGKNIFEEWLNTVDPSIQYRLQTKIERLKKGNFSKCSKLRFVKDVYEARLDIGPGYRIYFSDKDDSLKILCGGIKCNQTLDAQFAQSLT